MMYWIMQLIILLHCLLYVHPSPFSVQLVRGYTFQQYIREYEKIQAANNKDLMDDNFIVRLVDREQSTSAPWACLQVYAITRRFELELVEKDVPRLGVNQSMKDVKGDALDKYLNRLRVFGQCHT